MTSSKRLPRNSISQIPLEEVARYPLPGTAVPGNFAFSPADRLITYLHSPDGTLTRQLYAYELVSGERHLMLGSASGGMDETNVTLSEALRRERKRQLTTGVTHYAWSPKSEKLLIPMGGDVSIIDAPGSPLRLLVEGPAEDPHFSPDGLWLAYVQDAELFIIPTEGGEPRQMTFGARETGKSNGLAEYVAQEEMNRHRGYWWSPDSQQLAFVEVDESHLPIYRIVHQGKNVVGPAAQEDHRYPFAGEDNVRVRLGVIPVSGGQPVWMDLGPDEDIYLARVRWLPDGSLSAQLQNREQSTLELIRFDPATGRRRTLLREESDLWINLHHSFVPLKQPREDGGSFVWASERTGFRHLYLFDENGELVRPLTAGEWQVDGVAAVAEKSDQVYFTGTLDSPLEAHLYAVSLSGGEPKRLTSGAGIHRVVLDRGRKHFVDTYSGRDKAPSVTLRSLKDGRLLATLYNGVDPRVEQLDLRPPELITLTTRDGETLHGAIYHPLDGFGQGPPPAIVSVYGGPHVQRVTEDWTLTVDMRAQYLSRLGFLVFRLDNRGSNRRGLAFEGSIKHNMGDLEVRDQVDGVRWLVENGLADPGRIGVYGWSYGGYMALMCLARAPEIFHAAVAGAPVTDWDGYDTHYTERYMGTPASNPDGYRSSSVMSHVGGIRGKLLLVHSLLDENVHFRHTARLINALIAAGVNYDLLVFPDGRHSLRKLEDRIYQEERISRFFTRHLKT